MSLLKVTEAASYLGLSPNTLNKWRTQGCGPQYIKLGRSIGYRVSDLEGWLDSHIRSSTSQPAVRAGEAR